MYINFSSNLFLEKAELVRFKESLDVNGFRKLLLENSLSFGLIKNTTDSSFDNGLIQSGTNIGTIKVNSILAIDSDGLLITREEEDNITITDDSLWYWIKLQHQYSSKETGLIEIDANGNVTGVGTEFTKLLRGQPNFPSKIRLINSLYNNLEYEVLEVIDDENLVLNIMSGTVYPETNLNYKIVGTFTPGYSPISSEKYPFQYDSCLFTLEQSETRPTPIGEDGKSFYIGRVKRTGSSILIEDGRTDIWKTKEGYELSYIDTIENPLFGVESIKWDSEYATRDKNLVYLAWNFRSSNFTIDFSTNKITLNAGEGGKFKTTSDFVDGDFDGWRVYFQSGNYAKIKQSSKTGSQINLILDSLPSNELKDLTTETLISQELVITPNVEAIQIKFNVPIANLTELPEQTFELGINNPFYKCPVLVYGDNSTYEVEYRYKKFNDYSEWYSMPSDTAGYYNENQFDNLGELIVSPIRTPYTTSILLSIATQSYRNFNLGDLLGIEHYTLTTTLRQLYVGSNKQYQLIEGTPTIGANTFINLNKTLVDLTTPIRNGNSFILHITATPTLAGGTLKIVQDYIASPESYTLLKELTIKETQFLADNTAGLFLRFTYDGTNWIYSSVNEIEPRGKIVMFSGSISSNFDATGLGKNEWLGWALANGNNSTPNLQEKFIVGLSPSNVDYATIGLTGGTTHVSLVSDEMPSHTHAITDPQHHHDEKGVGQPSATVEVATGSSGYFIRDATTGIVTGDSSTGITIGNTGAGDAHENRPPYYVLAYVMKL